MGDSSMNSQSKASTGRRGLMLVLSSPSGAGKTSARRILAEDDNLALSVSALRVRHAQTVDGRDYHFVDQERFDAMVEDAAFLNTPPCLAIPMAHRS